MVQDLMAIIKNVEKDYFNKVTSGIGTLSRFGLFNPPEIVVWKCIVIMKNNQKIK